MAVMLALGGAGLLGAYKVGAWAVSGDAEAQGTEYLLNRPWLERAPVDRRDMIGHLTLVKHPEGRAGITGRSSQWRHGLEVFLWGLRGDKLMLHFPQEDVRGFVKVKTWKCGDEAPAPFDLCLEVRADGRSMTLYSREDWKIEPKNADASFAAIAEDIPALSATFDEASVAAAAADNDGVEATRPLNLGALLR